jgi:hypothetical protein
VNADSAYAPRARRRAFAPLVAATDGEVLAAGRVFDLIRDDSALSWRVFVMREGNPVDRPRMTWRDVLDQLEPPPATPRDALDQIEAR